MDTNELPRAARDAAKATALAEGTTVPALRIAHTGLDLTVGLTVGQLELAAAALAWVATRYNEAALDDASLEPLSDSSIAAITATAAHFARCARCAQDVNYAHRAKAGHA